MCGFECIVHVYTINTCMHVLAIFHIQYIIWNIISIGLNIVIVLIYQDIGLLAQVKKILLLVLYN